MLNLSVDMNEPVYVGGQPVTIFGVSDDGVVYASVGGQSSSLRLGEWTRFNAGRFMVRRSTTRYGGVCVVFDYPRAVKIGRKEAA